MLSRWSRSTTSTRQALRKSFEEAQSSTSSATGICAQCYPVLSRHADTFKGMVHQGTELKKKKKVNPYPKRPESELVHYRDVTKQNERMYLTVWATIFIVVPASELRYRFPRRGLLVNVPSNDSNHRSQLFRCQNLRLKHNV